MQSPDGTWREFLATEGIVLDTRKEKLQLTRSGQPELVLVTCFPFDAPFAGSPLRYVVRAVPAATTQVSGGPG